jgi:hypothetical protein
VRPVNIDSRRALNAQDRFKKPTSTIRLLRILILQIFHDDFFNSIDPTATSATPACIHPISSLDGMTPDQAYFTPLPVRAAA